MATTNENVNVIVTRSPKSVGIALALTFFFGPLGMFYSTIWGAIIMLILTVIIGILTMGFGVIITQIICLIWAGVAASSHNKKLMKGTI